MKRRVLFVVGTLLVALTLLSVYTLRTIGTSVAELRAILDGGGPRFEREDLVRALAELDDLRARLDGMALGLLKLLPVAHQNLNATAAIVDAGIPAVRAALESATFLDTEEDNLFIDGVVQVDRLQKLEPLLARQQQTLKHLSAVAREELNGWLLPSAWNATVEVAGRSADLDVVADRLHRAVQLAPAMFGDRDARRYGVLLVNNAELRGAGGIVSAIGSLTLDAGRLEVGKFRYYKELSDPYPYRDVPAPPDLARRFGRYWADTTLWVNATTSPDVPEVADVVSELFELTAGQHTDGVLIVDPRGLASFLDSDDDIDTAVEDVDITAGELPRFVYSDAYEIFQDPSERREALLALAPAVLDEVKEELDLTTLRRIAGAAAGGHLRFVPQDQIERELMVDAGIAGELTTTAVDSVLVTVQNLGADKLDYWVERSHRHGCEITLDSAHCVGSVRLSHEAPDGLPRYVTQGKTDYTGYLDVYLPEKAEVEWFGIDDEPVGVAIQTEDGRQALGLPVKIARGDDLTATYEYDLPLQGNYSLELSAQPLARDASLSVSLSVPNGWVVAGPDGEERGGFSAQTALDANVRLEARPDGRRGLSAWWETLVDFWARPL